MICNSIATQYTMYYVQDKQTQLAAKNVRPDV